MSVDATTPSSAKRARRGEDRVAAACDLCKSRKVKCDGNLPCSYCCKKSRSDSCIFSGPRTQRNGSNAEDTQLIHRPRQQYDALRSDNEQRAITAASVRPRLASEDHEDRHDTVVPLEARLLRDAKGKMIFIGDCAPISFVQTVRQAIAAKIPSAELPLHTSRDAVIERSSEHADASSNPLRYMTPDHVDDILSHFYEVTCGLVDFFDDEQLAKSILALVCEENGVSRPGRQTPTLAVLYLVIAIGGRQIGELDADIWFELGKAVLLSHVNSDMTIDSVRGFALVSIWMLGAFQPNAAYLNFGLATRCGYAIGLHRSEVNASFGAELHALRDRTWKSIRVVDMLISNMLGRPTSSADIDCTISYQGSTDDSHDFLNASIQIFLIIERIVLEVYSRKCISLRIAGYISHQIKTWATKWVPIFTIIIDNPESDAHDVFGACRNLCSYHYSIMLLTRPFLIYQLHAHLGTSTNSRVTHAQHRDKTTYAKAARHAASELVEVVFRAMEKTGDGLRIPTVLPWLFTATLVLVVALLGKDGPSLISDCRRAIDCLEAFDDTNPQAEQYLKTVKALFEITKSYALEQESRVRKESERASSALFGLYPGLDKETGRSNKSSMNGIAEGETVTSEAVAGALVQHAANDIDWTPGQGDVFALPWLQENDLDLQNFLQPGPEGVEGGGAGIPLFPIFPSSM